MKLNYLLVISLLLSACTKHTEHAEFDTLIQSKDYSVILFFAPDCPLCSTFSKPYNALVKEYPQVQFIAVQSGEHYSNHEIDSFVEETYLLGAVVLDPDYAIANRFHATVTPEFLLIDKVENVLYQGLLDDRMQSLGVYKQNWSKNYLKDAIQATLGKTEVEVAKTEPIGCVLEY